MEAMSSRERIVAALHGQPVDRIPFTPFLAYVWEHFPKAIQDAGQPAFLKQVGADLLWRGTHCPASHRVDERVKNTQREENGRTVCIQETPVGTLQSAWQVSEAGKTNFIVEHPLKTEDDFKVQLWIEEHTQVLSADPTPIRQLASGEGLAIGMLIPRAKTAFQSLIEHHVGTTELMYALADFPDTVNALLQAMVKNDLDAARIAAETPYEYLLTWEDSSTQNYSPALYRQYIQSEIAQFCQILGRKKYIQHACGHLKALLPLMQESGIFAVESLSPTPTGDVGIREARQILGKKTGIIGGIEPVHFLELPEAELPAHVEQVIEEAQGGPFVLANADSCPPGVTPEKFACVARTVKELSRAACV